MTVNKRKKSTRYRASQTHGGGAKKKRRGAGHRGGRGNAGSGKRADSKKPSNWKERYFGKFGFTSKSQKPEDTVINLYRLQEMLPQLIAGKAAVEQGGMLSIDLGKAGYTKLLGTGNVGGKMSITVQFASQQAVEKIKAAGGNVLTSPSPAAPPEKKGERKE